MAQIIPLRNLPVADLRSSDLSGFHFSDGAVILVDKPEHWSSFDVVAFVRNRIKIKKVGHAGTLDPLATGLLILCCGKATKSISQIQEMKKTYVANIRFGSSTPSYDTATDPDNFAEWKHIRESDIKKVINENFMGEVEQVPPIYSAIKVKGERLYKKARRGESVELSSRTVHIYDWNIYNYENGNLHLMVECSKGTYVRSLAHDLGIVLNSRAHLESLRRTKIGYFSVDHAFTPAQFENRMNQ